MPLLEYCFLFMAITRLLKVTSPNTVYYTSCHVELLSKSMHWSQLVCVAGVRVLFQVAVVLVRRCLGEGRLRKECDGQMETLEKLRGVKQRVQNEQADTFIHEVLLLIISAHLNKGLFTPLLIVCAEFGAILILMTHKFTYHRCYHFY